MMTKTQSRVKEPNRFTDAFFFPLCLSCICGTCTGVWVYPYVPVVIWLRLSPTSSGLWTPDLHLVVLYPEVSEVWPCWKKYVHHGGLQGFMVSFHSQFVLSLSCAWFEIWAHSWPCLGLRHSGVLTLTVSPRFKRILGFESQGLITLLCISQC